MFKRLRYRIIAFTMAVLVIVFAGTLVLIYAFSYKEVQRKNIHMLKQYIDDVTRPEPTDGGTGSQGKDKDKEPLYKLTVFFYVILDGEGEAAQISNGENSGVDDLSLASMATRASVSGAETGVLSGLLYAVKGLEDGGKIVAFMNGSASQSSFDTLFRYALIFGLCVIVVLFVFSWLLSGRMVRPLEESFKKQRQFISDAGHELKTPISVISASSELLERENGASRWLDNIRTENDRMAVLVNDLLKLARAENVKPVYADVDLSSVVTGCALPFESVAYEKGVSFSCAADDGVTVHGAAEQLGHLTGILIDNALEHVSRGGSVGVELTAAHGVAVLAVSNTGEEIPLKVRENIFERFYRADESRTSDSGHYGLGLAIAKAITSAHGGRIAVDCENGTTTFTVHIPRA